MTARKFRGMSLRRPCAECPFRCDIDRYLSPHRYLEIAAQLVDRALNFPCHKTVNYDQRDPGSEMTCAGAMIWLQHQGRPNQMMTVMGRLGVFDPARLDMTAPVYRTRAQFETGDDDV